jgi:hypothetical protein
MDTDELTLMAYDCILFAEKASDVLKIESGAAARHYKTEDEYLNGILEYVKEIEVEPENYLDDWNLLEEIDQEKFKTTLIELRKFIKRIICLAPKSWHLNSKYKQITIPKLELSSIL